MRLPGGGGGGILGPMTWRQRVGAASTEVALAVASLLLGYLGAYTLFSVVSSGLPPGELRTSLGLLTGPAVTGTAAFAYWKAAPYVVPEPIPPAPEVASLGRTAVAVVLGIVAAIGGSVVIGLIMQLVGVPVEEQSTVLDIVGEAQRGEAFGPAITLVVSAVVLAPVFEEWLFRGNLFVRTRARAGSAAAYIVSALAFAAIHGNPSGLPVYAWLAICFAGTMVATGRLGAAVAVHMGNNAIVLLLLFTGIDAGM